jgi:hypothetical protein
MWSEGVRLGRELIRLHTWGERCPDDGRDAPSPFDVAWESRPTVLPADSTQIRYDVDTLRLVVADGVLTDVSPAVWDYEVSGWPVVPRWLEHRTARGRGRRGSELDTIRPNRWHPDWTSELVELVRAIQQSVELHSEQDDLLTRICDGPLVAAAELPDCDDAQRAVPRTERPDEPPRLI